MGPRKTTAMNTTTRLKSSFTGILAAASVLGCIALAPSTVHAQTQVLVTATDTLPTMGHSGTAFYFDAAGQTYANTSFDLGIFSFSPTNVDQLNTMVGVQIGIDLNDLNTMLGTAGYGTVDLTLDGVDTGIAMNGYGTSTSGPDDGGPDAITGITSTATVTVNSLQTTVAAEILNLFQNGGYTYSIPAATNGVVQDSFVDAADPKVGDTFYNPVYTSATTGEGQIVVGLTLVGGSNPTSSQLAAQQAYASDNSAQEVFLEGGNASLEIANYSLTPVPFEPSQALGLGLIALFIALWFIPQTKQMMQRMLVPTRA